MVELSSDEMIDGIWLLMRLYASFVQLLQVALLGRFNDENPPARTLGMRPVMVLIVREPTAL